MLPETGLHRFVRGLLAGGTAMRRGQVFVTPDGRRGDAAEVEQLIADGALAGHREHCSANAETAGWLKRARLDGDSFATQHRTIAAAPDGTEINLSESPLARLAAGIGGEGGYLERHQIEAGERVRRLVERAQLQPRLTMSYSAAHTAGSAQRGAGDITDLAADARRALDDLYRVLPRDCAGVVLDVCGLLKGLQEVERERGWPRRSAKLVLRIGLEHLAQHYGFGAVARGKVKGRTRQWMDGEARPSVFG
jgi:Domain of unknown function (DUF6456)